MNVKPTSQRTRSAGVGHAIVAALAFILADLPSALAQTEALRETSVFTIIVTRHGVRSFKDPGPPYTWAKWDPLKDDDLDLTAHGYRLARLMGRFYREAQGAKGLPVDCAAKTSYVYADTVQRTLGTAHALIEGLCGSPAALEVFHASDTRRKDPIFDATERLSQLHKIDAAASKAAVAAVAGSPPSSIVMRRVDDFAAFQRLLDTRCGSSSGCRPIVSAASTIEVDKLAGLKGPIATASTETEDVFLEFAQCRPEKEMTTLDGEQLRVALDAGMRLHVTAYDVNARNAYNPLVRGGTLIAHVAAMLDDKAGRKGILDKIGIPNLDGKSLVIVSGHDTELGSLGGILNAHWSPEGGIVRDDMPPAAALVFDLVKGRDGDYGVRLRLAAMARDQYRAEKPFTGPLASVAYTGCPKGDCVMPLAQFESLALTIQAQGLAVDGWDASPARLPQDPGSVGYLKDPPWTEPQCRGP